MCTLRLALSNQQFCHFANRKIIFSALISFCIFVKLLLVLRWCFDFIRMLVVSIWFGSLFSLLFMLARKNKSPFENLFSFISISDRFAIVAIDSAHIAPFGILLSEFNLLFQPPFTRFRMCLLPTWKRTCEKMSFFAIFVLKSVNYFLGPISAKLSNPKIIFNLEFSIFHINVWCILFQKDKFIFECEILKYALTFMFASVDKRRQPYAYTIFSKYS